jgi:Protein of unknown function (DUF2946)
VSGFAANRLNVPAGGLRQKSLARNKFIAFLAILGLYLQLAAGALCAAGSSAPDLSSFPICHSASEQSPASKTGNVPDQHQQSCPFCALHCHAALLLPLAFIFASRSAIAKLPEALRHLAQPHLRYSIAAQPRGPPIFV